MTGGGPELDPLDGPCLQGYVTATYAALVAEFGEPGPPGDPDKSHLEWQIDSGYVGPAALYDYGDVHDCDGHWYVPMTEPIEWHVAARHRGAVDWVAHRLGVEPHYPLHAGCCGPELTPWWIAEREAEREVDQETEEDSAASPAGAEPEGGQV